MAKDLSKLCEGCGVELNEDRLLFLEIAKFGPRCCKGCSTAVAKTVLMEYSHKTAGTAVVIPNNPEAIRLAKRAYRRAR